MRRDQGSYTTIKLNPIQHTTQHCLYKRNHYKQEAAENFIWQQIFEKKIYTLNTFIIRNKFIVQNNQK